eukprot:gnl/Dysnectes_brevis/6999_a11345_212.p1 GENE.gnl/Dysnectes_brevis/6999_a11345_212~~gnl/Dysnectes_brevis/6999_a11345_212.p1  ORF type:complete len:637 (-),score=152.28 gnl/Dysnectes_brevis/6999_a11345_212:118-2028(-)
MPNSLPWHEPRVSSERIASCDTSPAKKYFLTARATAMTAEPSTARRIVESGRYLREAGRCEQALEVLEISSQTLLLKHNFFPEQLLTLAIQICEESRQLDRARKLLGRFCRNPARCWRLLLAGARMEARGGDMSKARKIIDFICLSLPTNGPAILDSIKLEESYGSPTQALALAMANLAGGVRSYGPLWFLALRIHSQHFPGHDGLQLVHRCAEQALAQVSQDVKWKVHLMFASTAATAGNMRVAYERVLESALIAPESLRWRVWTSAARLELATLLEQRTHCVHNTVDKVDTLLKCAYHHAPRRSRPSVIIEKARAKEIVGEIDAAVVLLRTGIRRFSREWKLHLELVLLLRRSNRLESAIAAADHAIERFPNTGRLWAARVSLAQSEGEERQSELLQQALLGCPKSGEVWCELARVRLNPLNKRFSASKAKQAILRAVSFTPQYGDSFIEWVRLSSLRNDTREMQLAINSCVEAKPNYGRAWGYCRNAIVMLGRGSVALRDGSRSSPPALLLRTARVLGQDAINSAAPLYRMAQKRRGKIRAVLEALSAQGKDPSTITLAEIETIIQAPQLTETTPGQKWTRICRKFPFNTALLRLDMIQQMCQHRNAQRDSLNPWLLDFGERFRLITCSDIYS